jgi:hypothetical protein
VILRQYPLAGHPLDRQDTISLVVAAEGRETPHLAPAGGPAGLGGR